jgi:hypothetical protein
MQPRKHLEDLIGILLLEADSIVTDRHQVVAFPVLGSVTCSDVNLWWHVGLAVFDRIADQVLKQLLQLPAIAHDNRQVFSSDDCLHGHECVPTSETGNEICQSDGCPTVSPEFLKVLGKTITKSKQPVLLWIFE